MENAKLLIQHLKLLGNGTSQDVAVALVAADVLEKLIMNMQEIVRCPCCNEAWECLEECTYSEDFPKEYRQSYVIRETFLYSFS